MKIDKFSEIQLQIAWNKIENNRELIVNFPDDLQNQNLTENPHLNSGFKLLSAGRWNIEAGPDFLDAKFENSNGDTVIGDVEIHKKSSDWVTHGHHNDRRYDNVILHVVADDNSKTCSSDIAKKLPNIPVVILAPSKPNIRISKSDKFPHGKCEKIFSALDDSALEQLFRNAGYQRFDEKVDLILQDISDDGVNQSFIKRIFDACGYKNNRKQFAILYDRFSKYQNLSPIEREAVLWGESGLLPDPAVTKLSTEMELYTKKLWECWWKIRKESHSPIEWCRTGTRPMNSPERRIAALTLLLSQLSDTPLLKLAKIAKSQKDKQSFFKDIQKILHCSHTLWDSYNSFNTKSTKTSAVLGLSRSSAIFVNIIVPTLKAYSIIIADPALGEYITNVYEIIPKNSTNIILETAALKWFMPPARQKRIFVDAITQQGAIHIYRNFCVDLCNECEICPLADLLQW